MKNKVQQGKKLDFVNTTGAAILSGDLVIFGALVGVAITDIGTGETGAVDLEGVYTFAKAAGAITQGAKLYWVIADKTLTTTASTNPLVGAAAKASLTGDAEGYLLLTNAN